MRFQSITLSLITAFIILSCGKKKNDCSFLMCDIRKPAGTYDYPIKPGAAQWASFTSQQEKLGACQIPQSNLNSMSTEAVMQSSLDLPVLGDLLLNVGVNVPGITEFYMTNFSGLIELSKRADAGSVMLNRYLIMNPVCAKCNYIGYTSDFNAFEMIIGQDSIIRKLTLPEKKQLVIQAIANYSQKKNMPEYYALYGLSTPLYVCTKVMINDNYKSFIDTYYQSQNLQLFVSKLLWPSDNSQLNTMFDQIINTAFSFSH